MVVELVCFLQPMTEHRRSWACGIIGMHENCHQDSDWRPSTQEECQIHTTNEENKCAFHISPSLTSSNHYLGGCSKYSHENFEGQSGGGVRENSTGQGHKLLKDDS